jgi:hypothetical protein
MVVKCLAESMDVEATSENNDYAIRLRRRGEHPTLVKFTSFSKKLEVVKNNRNSASSEVRVDKEYSTEIRKITR